MTATAIAPPAVEPRPGHAWEHLVPRTVEARVLTDDAEAIAAAEAFADRVRPGSAQRDRDRVRPFAEVVALRESGLLGMTVPKRFGGAGVSARTVCEVFRTISAADPALGQIPQNHFTFVANVYRNGDEAQQAFFSERFLAGDLLGNALSEKGPKPVALYATTVTPTDDGHVVNGTKAYCTGALYAQWVPTMCVAPDGSLRVAYVSRTAAGLSFVDDWNAMGQIGTASGGVVLDQVRVPDEHVLVRDRGGKRAGSGAFGQIMHVAIDLGIAEEALRDGVAYLRDKARPIADSGLQRAADEPHQLRAVGELHVCVAGARALLQVAADLMDASWAQEDDEELAVEAAFAVATAKAAANDAALRVTTAIFELGGSATSDAKYGLDRHWRNARTHTLHDPVRWKHHHLGNWIVNAELPPAVALI